MGTSKYKKPDEKGTGKTKQEKVENKLVKGQDDAMSAVAAATPVSLPQCLHHARQLHALLVTLSIPLANPAYTALVCLSLQAGTLTAQSSTWTRRSRQRKGNVRLWTYSYLLQAYCG